MNIFPWRLQYKFTKPYLEIGSAFGLTRLINKPTRSTLKISSLLDHILTNSKESSVYQTMTSFSVLGK